MGRAATVAMRGLALKQIHHVTPVRPAAAGELASRVYRQVEREFGVLAPPIALHSPAPEVMAASWLMLRESMLAPGLVGRAHKEAIAAAVSIGNSCPYCVTVHGATLHGLVRGAAADTIAADRIDLVADPALRAAAAWARAGSIRDVAAVLGTPFPARQAPEHVGVAVTFHYLNRMVNVFLEDAPMPPGAPRQGLAMVKRVLSFMIRGAARRIDEPGASLGLLPEAPLPADLGWALDSGPVAQAFARACAAIDRAGERTVPVPVRRLVLAELADWDGRPLGPSAGWVQRKVLGLDVADRAAGRLALLVALSSYQVSEGIVEDYRLTHTGDPVRAGSARIETAAWSAMAAARRIGAWMPADDRDRAGTALAD
jgi:AhpD family alkylhydroperoxidase